MERSGDSARRESRSEQAAPIPDGSSLRAEFVAMGIVECGEGLVSVDDGGAEVAQPAGTTKTPG